MTELVNEDELPEQLQRAIVLFRAALVAEGYGTPDSVDGMCVQLSAEFRGTLFEHDIDSLLEDFNPEYPEDRADYPYDLSGCWCHWAVRVGEVVICWTARQFDAAAPFPLIWKCPVRARRNEDAPKSQGEPHGEDEKDAQAAPRRADEDDCDRHH